MQAGEVVRGPQAGAWAVSGEAHRLEQRALTRRGGGRAGGAPKATVRTWWTCSWSEVGAVGGV